MPPAPALLDPGLLSYWGELSVGQRRSLLRLPKKDLFARVRALFCSGCFALVQLVYDELVAYAATQAAAAARNGTTPSPHPAAPTASCPVCAVGHACFTGLTVCSDGSVTLTDDLLSAQPFGRFEQAREWDARREAYFSCAEVCGGGWFKRPGVNKCKLHTGPVSLDELLNYWDVLPAARRDALLTLEEETFLGELDVSMKLQLRICKECRSNVTRAFKELKPGRDATAAAAATAGAAGAAGQPPAAAGAPAPPAGLFLCDAHELRAGEGRVRVDGPGDVAFFERAEEVQEQKVRPRHAARPLQASLVPNCRLLHQQPPVLVRFRPAASSHLAAASRSLARPQAFDPASGDSDSPETIRHAETPELAREALQDAALLIFKAQV